MWFTDRHRNPAAFLIYPYGSAYRDPTMPVRGSTALLQRTANNVRRLREDLLLTKAELARKAGVSALTVTRVERGAECRVDTKRKIILALGLQPADRERVFGTNEPSRTDAPAFAGRKRT
jgi:DNA-binding XRE family transcriptional regulator